MAILNPIHTRRYLETFELENLFVEELGWSPPPQRRRESLNVGAQRFELRPVAALAGVVVFEVMAEDGTIPEAAVRAALHKQVEPLQRESLLIFRDHAATQMLWYWIKREEGKRYPRAHLYVRGQPGDLFLSKLAALQFELADFDEQGNANAVQVIRRLRDALDVERVTRRFFDEFQRQHLAFLSEIEGIPDEATRRWYASVLLNRLMFIYFLQRKGFLDGGRYNYLQEKLAESQQRGPDRYFSEFLQALFFEGFARQEPPPAARALIGTIPYLNGSLFIRHRIESDHAIRIPDAAFTNLFALFERYSWNLNDTPGGQDNEINPDVLGYIFEKYINQKAYGAYYTRPEITEYLCEQTIYRLILDRVAEQTGRRFESMETLLLRLDGELCGTLVQDILPKLSLLDPACGSGAFLVAALKTLVNVYGAIVGRIEILNHRGLKQWLEQLRADHPSTGYFIKKKIIAENLFGVDLMEEATEIAKVRLFLALVASVERVEQLEPLPNIDFNILAGNSLVGLLGLEQAQHVGGQLDMLFWQALERKNEKIALFRDITSRLQGVSLQGLRDEIEDLRKEATPILNGILLKQFIGLGIQYGQATWDVKRNKAGKSRKRPLSAADIAALHPLHWGYEFSTVMNERGGFDAIITNPPWDIFKPNSREFFAQHANDITINKMSRAAFDARQRQLLQGDAALHRAWEAYLSTFSHLSAFFRGAPQFANQISEANGRTVGSDVNLFKLFVEQSYHLLRPGGQCGIVIPSGIYTDLGAKGLRELLFQKNQITGLFGFENRRAIFEGVDSRFKFVVLTFSRGGSTDSFPAAFMRHDVAELTRFPRETGVTIAVPLIRKLSPDSLSIMELNSAADIAIAQKLLAFPLLGAAIENAPWHISLTREFDMTNDRDLFQDAPAPGRLPLYEGKMIHQFDPAFAPPRFWVEESAGRARLLKRGTVDVGQPMDYQGYRLGFRDIAASTNERTLISTILPPAFHGNKIPTVRVRNDDGGRLIGEREQLLLCALWNSFTLDWVIRLKVTTTLNFFYLYQLPVPRLAPGDRYFDAIVQRAAQLICTTPAFDDLAQAVGLGDHKAGVTEPAARATLRAELDGMVAHLYGLTEEEFSHILATFPLVPDATREAALVTYRALVPLPGDPETARLLQDGENDTVEFKIAARYSSHTGQKDSALAQNIVKAVAGFLNSAGGTLLIGVDDKTGHPVGIAADMRDLLNLDKYRLAIEEILAHGLGAAAAAHYRLTFPEVGGTPLCRITVQPSPHPVYVQGHLYVRLGNRTQALPAQEAVLYLRSHWR